MTAIGFDVASLTDAGPRRERNEDHCGVVADETSLLVAVADGVSGGNAGDVASRMAIEGLFRAHRELSEVRSTAKRLHRAAQRANLEIYDLAVVVPELRGMSTTLTAAVVEGGALTAVHVGDSRLYRVRTGTITQLTKDHTVAGERMRAGLMSAARARAHPDRSVLTRALGRELISPIDTLSTTLEQDDTLIVCSDGLYGVLADRELLELVRDRDAVAACQALIAAAHERATPDNATVAVVRITGAIPRGDRPGLVERLRRTLVR